MRRVLVGIAVLLSTSALAQTRAPVPIQPQAPTIQAPPIQAQTIRPDLLTYVYTARTAAHVRRVGQVTAGGITWSCAQLQCSVTGPWPTPGVGSCHALAREVGRITAYGHPNAQLNAAQLVLCNAMLPSPPPPPAGLPPATMRSGELLIVGGEQRTPEPRPPPVAIRSAELSIVGGVQAAPETPDPPIIVRSGELSIVGQ